MSTTTKKGTELFRAFVSLDKFSASLLALSNALLIGQDWLMFAQIQNGSFSFAQDFRQVAFPAYHGLLLPQAWTLGIELTFYVIAPFVLPQRWLMAALLLVSLAFRIVLIRAGVGMTDPWTYRFFPAELLFFLIGSFIHQIGLPAYRMAISVRWDDWITAGIAGAVAAYPLLPIHELLKSAGLMGLCALALPALFRFQHGRKWDLAIGDLSYPIYINHVLVIALLHVAGLHSADASFALLAAGISISLAILMNASIGAQVERWRAALKAGSARSREQRIS